MTPGRKPLGWLPDRRRRVNDMPLNCEIVTQDRVLYEGPADSVQAPGSIGEMGILPNHAPLLTTLAYGVLRVRNAGEEMAFTVAGVMEVRPETVIVLADVGENVEEIDLARAEAARARAEALLQQGTPADTDEYLALEAALRRSKLRLDAARRYGKGRKPGFPGSAAEHGG
jgi:F-type H+-transporting ATPase subunit epsilon